MVGMLGIKRPKLPFFFVFFLFYSIFQKNNNISKVIFTEIKSNSPEVKFGNIVTRVSY